MTRVVVYLTLAVLLARSIACAADSQDAVAAKSAIRNKQFGAAMRTLQSAADRGDTQAAYLLGLMYATGRGTDTSVERARIWLGRAAVSDRDAALALSGILAATDAVSARKWLERSARAGQPMAAQLLAAHSLPMAADHDPGGDRALAGSLLLWAIHRGDEALVREFVPLAGATYADDFGRSALAHASMTHSAGIVRILLAQGADEPHADHFGVTALMLAAENPEPSILDALLELPAPGAPWLDARDRAGNRAVFYAARAGLTSNIERLIAAGAALDGINTDGWTVMDVAVKNGHQDSASVLRKAGAAAHLKASIHRDEPGIDVSRPVGLYQGWAPVAIAASRNDAALVASLLAGGASPDSAAAQQESALLIAAMYRAPDVIPVLMKAGADPARSDGRGNTPLGFAAAAGDLEVLDALLQKGVSPDIHGRGEDPPIIRAVRSANPNAVEHLLAAGANVNQRAGNGSTALMVSASMPDAGLARTLLAAHAGVELVDAGGRDALWLAVGAGSEEIADLLLAAGAPVDSDRKGPSPLFAAIRANRPKLLEHLLRKGLSPNPESASGDTPLLAAAALGNLSAVKVLLDGGAAIDSVNAAGNTALIEATREGHVDVCKLLLAAGANARLKNLDRIDALDTARRRNLQSVAALMGAS